MKPLATAAVAVTTLGLLSVAPSPAAGLHPTRDVRVVSTPGTDEIPTTGLTRGSAPRIPYLRGRGVDEGDGRWRLVRADGTRLRVPVGYYDFATLGRGAIGTLGTEAGVRIDRVGPAGRLLRSRTGYEHYGLVTTPDRSIVGYLGDDERLVVLEDDGRRRLEMARVRGADRPGALLGRGTCREQSGGGGCTAFLDSRRDTGARYTTSHGIVDSVPGLLSVTDVDRRGRLVGLTEKRPRCSGLLRGPSGRLAWHTCDHDLTAFSPDGRHVLGTRGRFDPTKVAVYDRAGDVVASRSFRSAFGGGHDRRLTDVAWESRRHLLAVVYSEGGWSILRLGLDGSVERVTKRLRESVDYPAYRLPVR